MKINFRFNQGAIKVKAEHKKMFGLAMAAVLFVAIMFLIMGTNTPRVQAQATATNTLTPTNTPTLTPTPLATALPMVSGNGLVQYLQCGSYNFGQITPGTCVQINNGSDIEVRSSAGRRTWYLDGETGNITSVGTTNGNKCYRGSQTVLGSATVIPATLAAVPITTPVWVAQSLAATADADGKTTANTNAAGVVTIYVYNASAGATPATTPKAVNYEVCGS